MIARLKRVEAEAQPPALDKSSALVALQFLIARHFNVEEIKHLSFGLEIDPSVLDGVGCNGKARELVLYCDRHGRLEDLLAAVVQERPLAPWEYAANIKS